MTGGWLDDTRASYDTVGESYADQTRHLMDDTPEERAVLALFADVVRARGGGAVADVGCGPGRITAELRQLGTELSRQPRASWAEPSSRAARQRGSKAGAYARISARVWLAWPSP